jgi:hypothetical protein
MPGDARTYESTVWSPGVPLPILPSVEGPEGMFGMVTALVVQ